MPAAADFDLQDFRDTVDDLIAGKCSLLAVKKRRWCIALSSQTRSHFVVVKMLKHLSKTRKQLIKVSGSSIFKGLPSFLME